MAVDEALVNAPRIVHTRMARPCAHCAARPWFQAALRREQHHWSLVVTPHAAYVFQRQRQGCAIMTMPGPAKRAIVDTAVIALGEVPGFHSNAPLPGPGMDARA